MGIIEVKNLSKTFKVYEQQPGFRHALKSFIKRDTRQVESSRYRRNVDLFTGPLDMGAYLKTPVRQLSLGQRMKADIAPALLHDLEILYLDEPTIGLDVLAKSNIRQFIRESNRLNGTTTILTSHDMKDLDQVCSRVVMIAKGRLHFDGDITLQEAMATITGRYQVADISVTEADIEQIVKDIYQKNHQPSQAGL